MSKQIPHNKLSQDVLYNNDVFVTSLTAANKSVCVHSGDHCPLLWTVPSAKSRVQESVERQRNTRVCRAGGGGERGGSFDIMEYIWSLLLNYVIHRHDEYILLDPQFQY